MAEQPKKDPQMEQWEKEAASTGVPLWQIIARSKYGYLSVFIDHPELGPLLQRAADGGWTKETFQGELFKTKWYKNTSETQRQWALLQASDPATAEARLNTKAAQFRQMVRQSGLAISSTAIRQVAMASMALGIDDAIAQRALFAQAHFERATGGKAVLPSGVAGKQIADIHARAADYGVHVGDERAFNYARRIAMGDITPETVEVDLKNLAKSRWTYLKEDIDRGNTVKDILDPYVQQYSELMGVAPGGVNFNGPNFRKFVEGRDPKQGGRLLSLDESATKIRQTSAWQGTKQARQAASGFAEQLLRQFGKVAG